MTVYRGPTVPVGLTDLQGHSLGSDNFGNLRIGQRYPLLDTYHKYEIDTHIWGQLTATGGTITHLPNESAAQLAVTAADGSRAMLRTHTFFRYQAGRPTGAAFSVFHSAAPTTLSLVRRTSTSGSVVDVDIPRSSWTHDKLDGAADSSFRWDATKGSIYELDIAWLGVRGARFFVNGRLIHVDDNTNELTVPYMTTANLPLTYEIVNVGTTQYRRWGYFSDNNGYFFQSVSTAASASLKQICTSVWSDGGDGNHDYSYAALAGGVTGVGTATPLPLIAIRPKLLYNSMTNRSVTLPRGVSASADGKNASIVVVMDPTTLTGGSWVSANALSSIEYNATATAISGGEVLQYAFVSAGGMVDLDIADLFHQLGRKLRLDAFGTVQGTLAVRGLCEAGGANVSDMKASIHWVENR